MNAHAHLISLGWAGPGHSLDSRPDAAPTYKQKGHRGLAYDSSRDPAKVGNTGTGLVKPLSISQRKARFGIGKKAHEPASGTEWWLKGFESALGNIGKSESERSSGTNTPIGNAGTRFNHGGGKHGGLYGFFIRGQLMEGTISEEEEEAEEESRGKKRKSKVLDEDTSTSEEPSSSTSNEMKKRKKGEKATEDFEAVATFLTASQKDEKRRPRKEKAKSMQQSIQVEQSLKTKEGDGRKKKRESTAQSQTTPTNESDLGDTTVETKEERRERRRKRKELKELKAKLKSNDITNKTTEERSQIQVKPSDDLAKAARRAERKRRKAENTQSVSIVI